MSNRASLNMLRPCVGFQHQNPIAELLDMIERRAPILMRSAGGSLNRESLGAGTPVPAEDVEEMNRLAREGKSLCEISRETGYAPCTCGRFTRETRGVKKRVFR